MKFYNILLYILVITVFTTGCEKLLEADSDRLVFPESHQLNSPNDTLYSMMGIFTKLEKLANRYVLLGELRGDLMDISDDADPYLQEISNFNITKDNPYNNVGDFYSVINHCNYLIQNIDTSVIANAEKVMYKEFAAAKAIRAWTYLQIALNYGKVYYYTNPILTVQDANTYQEYSLSELLPILIQDLEPWRDIKLPGGISLGVNVFSSQLFFPLRFVLGDLYLWNEDYEKAVLEYYNLIESNTYVIDEDYQPYWTVENGEFVRINWINTNVLGSSEHITLLASALQENEESVLLILSQKREYIFPSQRALDYWNQQKYYETANIYTYGDLRGEYISYYSPESYYGTSSQEGIIISKYKSYIISKYNYMSGSDASAISIYRKSLLYLRYAEALNRAGKPNAAFAVLKNGMNPVTISNNEIIPAKEKYMNINNKVLHEYFVFSDINFSLNVGVHACGCGNVELSTDYIIDPQNSLEDSILFVERKILEELALETAFEGNRFHDLMRIALRRNDPSFLADIVAEKYDVNKELIWSKLNDVNNWYLP